MKTEININEPTVEKDFFPALFTNKEKTILILADNRTSEKTFSGMIIHASSSVAKRYSIGTYSSGWTYEQFRRLPRGTQIRIDLEQSFE